MKITPDLLKKYAAGDCTEAERLEVEQWLSKYEDLSTSLPRQKLDTERKQVWQNLSANISAGNKTKVIPLYKKVTRYAVAVVLFLSVGVSAYFYLDHLDPWGTGVPTASQDYRNIVTQRGQKRTVNLPDGSTIRLNYESQLKVPGKFTSSERMVFLTGHAHFDIAKDPGRPFIIYTENSKTRVLGTSFDVKTYADSEHTEIIVASGKVEFSEKSKSQNKVVLTVNDRAVLGANHEIDVSKVNAQHLTAWKDNRLVFEKRSLAEIIEVLEPWYDVEIVVKDPVLLGGIYKLSYDNPSLETVMERMSFMGKFNYTIEGQQVTIY